MSRKTVTISIYENDLKAASKKMRALKKLGYQRMSLSRLMRIALRRLDVESIPPPSEGLE